ncbi:hypothetical protein PGTUg99_026657 [Puccinia graminis f. sp. tritici]|uniref:Uncharacterized protein n=1 Tax=Puccinia graminis f. sp. tritici TaxID=56615 RepID=A0A5B0NVY0_PUCGR|nr:hypothetical protein PGTUg99_026657 [Puccinia graminis f. sp. tritici]
MAHSHAPPLSSPLAHPGPRPAKALLFGATPCLPKQCILIELAQARQFPYLTSSASHQYRFTPKGIRLFALKGGRTRLDLKLICRPSSKQPSTPTMIDCPWFQEKMTKLKNAPA